MSKRPWMKFYPRDWRGDQALRAVSLAARGLWMEMLCIMHEASPYGHLLIGAKPVTGDALARLSGSSILEVQALLVELQNAHVLGQTRTGVIISRRMIADEKRAQKGRKDKLAALAQVNDFPPQKPKRRRDPSRVASTQKPDTRGKLEGVIETPSNLSGVDQDEARHEGASPSSPVLRVVGGTDDASTGMTVQERHALSDEIRASLGLKPRRRSP